MSDTLYLHICFDRQKDHYYPIRTVGNTCKYSIGYQRGANISKDLSLLSLSDNDNDNDNDDDEKRTVAKSRIMIQEIRLMKIR